MDFKPYVVGIAGGSASGKTSFLTDLRAAMSQGSMCVVSQDNYYKPQNEQQIDSNGEINFDLPESINRELFHEHMMKINRGESITINEYTFNNDKKDPGRIVVNPAPIIVIEGLFVFFYEEIRKSLDLRVFIDARESVKLERRLKRDAIERGYDANDVLYRWNHHVMPSFRKYLEPFRDDCHVILTNNSHYSKGLDVLKSHLISKLPEDFSNRFVLEKLEGRI
jgi:uridine kinase